jgi:hypothetical protein
MQMRMYVSQASVSAKALPGVAATPFPKAIR